MSKPVSSADGLLLRTRGLDSQSQLGSVHSSDVWRSRGGRFRDDTEAVRARGLRGLLVPLLLWRSSLLLSVGRRGFGAGLAGAAGAALTFTCTGATGGLCDFALGAESALLMVAAVWLEYPESLWRSMWTACSALGDLSPPRSDGFDLLAAMLALSLGWPFAGDRRNDSSTPLSWSLSSLLGQSSTVAWRGRSPAMADGRRGSLAARESRGLEGRWWSARPEA
jgi:hypothetical protein